LRLQPAKQIACGESPEPSQREGQAARGNIAALPGALRVARDSDERIDAGKGDHLGDERRGFLGKPAASVLLPRAYENARPLVVDDSRPSAREREPASCALGAPPDRPRPRRAAPVAERLSKTNERGAARLTERITGTRTYSAPLREQELEH
jgi:hypothetical protein